MYTPSSFSVEDNSFGIVISRCGEDFHDTHTPLYSSSDLNYLYGHIAKANHQWNEWKTCPQVKVIFRGPHTYISPSYYVGEFNVPIWNYTAVSISGRVEILDSLDEQKEVIRSLVDKNEKLFPKPWKFDEEDERLTSLFKAIVCFRVKVQTIEGKFKLNQNKDIEDRLSVIQHLKKTGKSMDLEIVQQMVASMSDQDLNC